MAYLLQGWQSIANIVRPVTVLVKRWYATALVAVPPMDAPLPLYDAEADCP
jgi:hypothetical protein